MPQYKDDYENERVSVWQVKLTSCVTLCTMAIIRNRLQKVGINDALPLEAGRGDGITK